MVIDWLVGALLSVVNGIVAVVPDVTLPTWAHADGPLRDAWQNLLGYMVGFDSWLPIEEVGVVAPAVLTVFTLTMSYRVVMWCWARIKSLPFL